MTSEPPSSGSADRSFHQETPVAFATLEARQLSVRRSGAVQVEAVSFRSQARRVAIVGDSGFLPKLLIAEAERTSGELLLLGEPPEQALARSTRLVPRDGWLLDDEPVLASLRFVADLFRIPHGARVAKHVLATLGLSQFSKATAAALEPAERTAVSLAMAVISGPRLLVLEEPLDALDDLRAAWLLERIELACSAEDAPRLVWTCERLLNAAQHELASRGDVVWLQYGRLLGAAPAAELARGSALCLVRVAGDGARLRRALSARGVLLESTGDAPEPRRTSSWRMHASRRPDLISAAVETETPVLDLQLIKPLATPPD
ncbi:MAG: hypothetical protein R3B89_26915 [Polyangiaceae bacterium]